MVQSIDSARRRHQGQAGARVPPHNLQAEESLLGAMLLSREAIASAIEAQLAPSDFYEPAHGHVSTPSPPSTPTAHPPTP